MRYFLVPDPTLSRSPHSVEVEMRNERGRYCDVRPVPRLWKKKRTRCNGFIVTRTIEPLWSLVPRNCVVSEE